MKPTDVTAGITKALLDEIFDVRPEEGLIFWRKPPVRKPFLRGQLAGHVGHRFGYVMICVNYKDFKRHRLIWFYVRGTWPTDELDHIDGDRSNDRISNLREATKSQNMWNMKTPDRNTSGRKGVSWDGSKKKWRATIRANGQWKQLGRFDSFEDAVRARSMAELSLHGEFKRVSA